MFTHNHKMLLHIEQAYSVIFAVQAELREPTLYTLERRSSNREWTDKRW